MEEDIRSKIFNELTRITLYCEKHPEDIANMLVTSEESDFRGIVCATCLSDSVSTEPKLGNEIKPLKLALIQIHQSCNSLLTSVPTAAFVDHHINLIRGIAKTHYKQIEPLIQASITNYFQKTRDLLNGKYFQEFYVTASKINAASHKTNKLYLRNENYSIVKKLFDFIASFDILASDNEEYQTMSFQDKLMGISIIKQIKADVGTIYKEFKEKAQAAKKNFEEDAILQLFNPSLDAGKSYKFSATLHHQSLTIIDHKKMKMPDLPDNQHTLIALIEPSIGSKKRSIKLKMDGIRGWVAAGLATRSIVENGGYKFEQTTNHGTVQMSYDGYSWSEDSGVNEQYTSWYYNQNDTLTMTVNPGSGELTFMRNEDSNVFTLKFANPKKEKLYFCVSVNYNEDAVSIID